MWYEILPALSIIYASVAVPAFTMYYVDKWILGNAYRRSQLTFWDRRSYWRDRILHDDPYVVWGLEHLEDDSANAEAQPETEEDHGRHEQSSDDGHHHGEDAKHNKLRAGVLTDDGKCVCGVDDDDIDDE